MSNIILFRDRKIRDFRANREIAKLAKFSKKIKFIETKACNTSNRRELRCLSNGTLHNRRYQVVLKKLQNKKKTIFILTR